MKTKRLVLRKWTEADAESLYEYAKDSEVGPIAGWPPHKSVEESLDVIRNVFNGPCLLYTSDAADEGLGPHGYDRP